MQRPWPHGGRTIPATAVRRFAAASSGSTEPRPAAIEGLSVEYDHGLWSIIRQGGPGSGKSGIWDDAAIRAAVAGDASMILCPIGTVAQTYRDRALASERTVGRTIHGCFYDVLLSEQRPIAYGVRLFARLG